MNNKNHDDFNENLLAAEEERKNFQDVKRAFKNYRFNCLQRLKVTEIYLSKLPGHHQEYLMKYKQSLLKIKECVDHNYKIVQKLLEDVNHIFLNVPPQLPSAGDSPRLMESGFRQSQFDKAEPYFSNKVEITLKLFVRDWSLEGAEERAQCYTPMINAITEMFNPEDMNVDDIRVLVPGAGLGRLAYELAYQGYFCEGNEFSYFMLFASNFLMNKCVISDQYELYPWIHQYVNNMKREDQIRPITFPDVSPIQAPPKGTLNMVAGDFLQVYIEWDAWDCVATCFFIDCANNVVEFVERIFRILKPGGIWVNLGPLLYHYSDIFNECSIEPTYEELQTIIETVGFKFLRNDTNVRTKYCQNMRSMQQSEYFSVFFVCQKPHEPPSLDRENDDNDVDKL